MTVVAPESRKIYFGLAKENGSKGIVIIKSHLITTDIHMRQHAEVMCGI